MSKHAYHELPRHGHIVLNTGEVLEYRAQAVTTKDGIPIIEDAYFINHNGEILGPFTLHMYPTKPTDKENLRECKWRDTASHEPETEK